MKTRQLAIMVAVSDPEFNHSLQVDLTRRGHDVVGTTSSKEAFDIVTTQPIDLILIDSEMTGSDGHNIADDLIVQCGENAPQLIHLTANVGRAQNFVWIPRFGGYLQRPFEMTELHAGINEMFDLNQDHNADVSETCDRDDNVADLDSADGSSMYLQATEFGDPRAQAKLGLMYYKGDGVEADYVEAVRWWRLAAEKNDRDAQFLLALCHRLGNGVAIDYAEAVNWYRLAAEQGHAVAQMNLAASYYSGEGVGEDLVESYAWLCLASEENEEAAIRLNGYEQMLSPEQLAAGQSRSMELRSQIEASLERSSPPQTGSEFIEGGLYYTPNESGTYSIQKILKVEYGIVHVRLYSNELSSPPANMDENALFLAGVNAAPDVRIGIGHVPLAEDGFKSWKPTFFQQSTVKDDELDGYRLWLNS